MSPTLDAVLRSWPFDPWLMAALALTGAVYTRGWLALRAIDPDRWSVGRWAAFQGGILTIYVALASPIETFAPFLLLAHMTQHVLLMMAAPPLIWLGAPLFPLVRGLPKAVRDVWVAPCLRSRPVRNAFTWLSQPWVAWPIFVGATWLWHAPRCYELALRQSGWHVAQHASFVSSALLFWYPIARPYPSRPRWSRWVLPPYLILAEAQNSLLAAWLTFSGVVLYPHYARVPRLAGISALDDQALAGIIMWAPGSIALMAPLCWISVGLLYGPRRQTSRASESPRSAVPQTPAILSGRPALPIVDLSRPAAAGPITLPRNVAPPSASRPRASRPGGSRPGAIDLLRIPGVGTLLRWRWFRPLAQLAMAVAAVAVIYDGLRGPRIGAMNLAGVLPWIHWRGMVVFGLLVLGNVFCMACPFTLPRWIAGRWLPQGRAWPRALRGKWLAAGLLAVFLWSYEAFSLWDDPWLTAWIALGYFAAALAVDGFFRGAAFCKYVCPIGQFNFVQSLVSPWEVKVREPAVCSACRTKDCIRGSAEVAGCQLQLFQPRKAGNLDCTFCLACVQACPRDNVGVLAVAPGQTLWSDRWRSGIGRFSRRPDLAALVLVLVFGAFVNAAGMVGPVVEWQARLGTALGNPTPLLLTTLTYLAAALAALVIAASVARASGAWGRLGGRWGDVATRFSFALVPLGFAMWLAHYSFHFLTSFEAIVPATQRFCADLGWTALGEPLWRRACCRPAAGWIPYLEILMLDFGLLLSLYAGFRIAETQTSSAGQCLKAFAPWGLLMSLLFAAGVWIVFQPMQMRGMLPAAG